MIKSFLTRLMTSIFVFVIFGAIGIASFYDIVFEVTISVLTVMCVYESICTLGFKKKHRLIIPSLLYAILLPNSFILSGHFKKEPYYFIIVLTFIYIIAFFVVSMRNFDDIKFNNSSTIMFSTIVITCFLSNIILLRREDAHGLLYMVLVIVCFSWATDVFAYLVGICIGKHKFSPKISPKKSIEGSIGGTLVSIGVTALTFFIYQKITGCTVDYVLGLTYGLICSVIGQIGDFSFSYIKRSYGIKDFSNLLPGHGGVLDRLDSMIFISPFFYMLITFSGFIS